MRIELLKAGGHNEHGDGNENGGRRILDLGLVVGEQTRPARVDFRLAEEPEQNKYDKVNEHSNLVEGERTELFVLAPDRLADQLLAFLAVLAVEKKKLDNNDNNNNNANLLNPGKHKVENEPSAQDGDQGRGEGVDEPGGEGQGVTVGKLGEEHLLQHQVGARAGERGRAANVG